MKAFTIFKAVIKNWMRSRSGLFFSILFPVLLLVVFGVIFSVIGGSSQYNLFVQNLDLNPVNKEPSELSTTFVARAQHRTREFFMGFTNYEFFLILNY